eukprot:6924495-Prymnesium_polylepis.1
MAAKGVELTATQPPTGEVSKKKARKGKQARQRQREVGADAAAKVAKPAGGNDSLEEKTIQCKDCSVSFVFSVVEQNFCERAAPNLWPPAAMNTHARLAVRPQPCSVDAPMHFAAADLQKGFELTSKVRCAECTRAKKGRSGAPADEAPVRCYNCGKNGHLSRACPDAQRRTCYHCGEEGHLSRECPQWQPDGSEIKCFHCGKTGHIAARCWDFVGWDGAPVAAPTAAPAAAPAPAPEWTCPTVPIAEGISSSSSSAPSKGKKDEVCKAFLSAAGCQRGDKCRFAHPERSAGAVGAPVAAMSAAAAFAPAAVAATNGAGAAGAPAASAAKAKGKKDELCKAFLSAGGCQRGDKCRFSHPK